MSQKSFSEMQALLSENIKALRSERALAQERLGLEAGVDRTLVSKIERQIANPTLEILVKLANCLDVPVHRLLSEAESNHQQN
jgi:transcriptional regulator with XRE-family HTH domain